MTLKNYLASSELTQNTLIVDIGVDVNGKFVRLKETLFHGQGGGQKSDKGYINDSPVINVQYTVDGEVNHYIDEKTPLTVGDPVSIVVDEIIRIHNTRLHSAGHFISAVAEKLFNGLSAVGGHHWPGESRVEFEGEMPTGDIVLTLENALAQGIADNLDVTIEGDPFHSRKIKFGDFYPVSCGGTHVKNTRELFGLRITGVKAKKGRLRISYDIT